MKGAFEGNEVCKNLIVGFKEACLAINYTISVSESTQSERATDSGLFVLDYEV